MNARITRKGEHCKSERVHVLEGGDNDGWEFSEVWGMGTLKSGRMGVGQKEKEEKCECKREYSMRKNHNGRKMEED